ncbi:hypothetical protein [Labrys wisconsinensis]|uniref:Uncharacterized protein n=1 Tax=Labrys wisconsinensis TaxID=425677 RepID=A0ABU0J4U9_9HYPH|nr:hypothetical protein [Labrys wisconsinensis]MDQ0468299.1 hypothetical protein [Labrys wisconsinensis]
MLMIFVSSLIAGAAVGLFARLLALVISMVVFSGLITAAGALTHPWSALEMAGIFLLAATVFQVGYLFGIAARHVWPHAQAKAPVAASAETRRRSA